MAYQYGTTDTQRLTVENRRLTKALADLTKANAALTVENRRLNTQHIQEQENAHTHAATLRTQIAYEAHRLVIEANDEATRIIVTAENQASLIRELAHDQGLALADRQYRDTQARRRDTTRAKRSLIHHLKAAS